MVAAYIVTAVVILSYAVMLYLRVRKEKGRNT
jgi:isoprenylcysteine carboxyl methyltransferase (ICMT) family protein YpbQ